MIFFVLLLLDFQTIWLVAFVASVLLGLDYGLLVAIVFTVLTVVFRTQRYHLIHHEPVGGRGGGGGWSGCERPLSFLLSPKSGILGHVPGTGLYYDVDEYEEVSL